MDGRSYYYKATSNATERQATSDKRQTARHPPIKKIPEKKEIKKVETNIPLSQEKIFDNYLSEQNKGLEKENERLKQLLEEKRKWDNDSKTIDEIDDYLDKLEISKEELKSESKKSIPDYKNLPKELKKSLKVVMGNCLNRFGNHSYGYLSIHTDNIFKWLDGNYTNSEDFETEKLIEERKEKFKKEKEERRIARKENLSDP